MMDNKTLDKLDKAGIPADDYAKSMDLVTGDDKLDLGEDPAENFKAVILYLNDLEILPSYLSEYCRMYGVDHKEPEIEPMDDQIEY